MNQVITALLEQIVPALNANNFSKEKIEAVQKSLSSEVTRCYASADVYSIVSYLKVVHHIDELIAYQLVMDCITLATRKGTITAAK